MAVTAYFGELRRFAVALERDTCNLRAAVERPPAGTDPNAGAVQQLQGLLEEVVGIRGTLPSFLGPEHDMSLGDLLDACERLHLQTVGSLDRLESELQQYGYVPPKPLPVDVHMSQPAALSGSATATVTANTAPSAAAATDGEEDAGTVSTTESAADEDGAAQSTESIAGEAQPICTPKAAAAVSQLAPHVLQPLEDPKTPTLEDFGISRTTLQALQGGRVGAEPMLPHHQQAQPTRRGSNLAPASSVLSPLADPLDAASYGIKSVAVLKTISPTSLSTAQVATPSSDIDLDDITQRFDTTSVKLLRPSAAEASPLSTTVPATLQPREFDMDAEPDFTAPTSAALGTQQLPPAQSTSSTADVTAQEYDTLSAYLKEQVSRTLLNSVLASLAASADSSGVPAAEAIFSEAELRDNLGLGAKTKATLLVLLKLRRLQARGASEQGDKLYSFF